MAVTVQLRSGAHGECGERACLSADRSESEIFFLGSDYFGRFFYFSQRRSGAQAAQFFKVEDVIKVKSTLAAEGLPKAAKVKSTSAAESLTKAAKIKS